MSHRLASGAFNGFSEEFELKRLCFSSAPFSLFVE